VALGEPLWSVPRAPEIRPEQSREPDFFEAKCHKEAYGTVFNSATVQLPSRREYFSALPLGGSCGRTQSHRQLVDVTDA